MSGVQPRCGFTFNLQLVESTGAKLGRTLRRPHKKSPQLASHSLKLTTVAILSGHSHVGVAQPVCFRGGAG